jgi:GTP cyclohydrolase I
MTQIASGRATEDGMDETDTGQIPTEEQAMQYVRGLLQYIGEDPDRDGLRDTPRRVVGTMAEHFRGYREDPAQYLRKTFTDAHGYRELVLVSNIELYSHCEHHMVPFVGKAHVAYIPDGRMVGISKLARVVDAFARRLQVQERLTAQIADAIHDILQPTGTAVILQCQHFCMCYRGVKKPGSWTTTSRLHGSFMKSPATRSELFTLVGLRQEVG